MHTIRWLKWLGIVLLAAGCAVTMTACGGGDGDSGGDDAGDEGEVGDAEDGGEETAALVVSQLLTPENGMVFKTLLLEGAKYSVDFEWSAVPGATSYALELSRTESTGKPSLLIVPGPRMTFAVNYGDYKWRVWAQDANAAAGPASGYYLFSVKSSVTAIPFP